MTTLIVIGSFGALLVIGMLAKITESEFKEYEPLLFIPTAVGIAVAVVCYTTAFLVWTLQ